MTLPASQYSVLDAKRIERIDDDTFRCYVGGISFLNFKVASSVLSSDISLLDCTVNMRNVLSIGRIDEDGCHCSVIGISFSDLNV